jgi:hypothetical protein
VTATGGTSPYTYSWNTDPAQTTATATGLTAGTYTVIVTDAHLCSVNVSATIIEPAFLTAIASHLDVNCSTETSGSATVTATGGTPAYSYMWSTTPVQTTQTATGLSAATYSVTVTDAHGCTTTASTTVSHTLNPVLTISSTPVNCYGGSNGTATVSVVVCDPDYRYLWSNGQTTMVIINLTAGTYTVTATDFSNPENNASMSVEVTQPSLLTAGISTQTNVSCNGQTDGSATVTATGGTPGYTYLWSNTQTLATAITLGAGTYTVTVTDVNG